MGWFWWPSSSDSSATSSGADKPDCHERRCKSRRTGLAGCRKANPGVPEVCKNLEIAVVQCLAEGLCKQEAAEHKKCYTSLYKTGLYKGVGHCIPYEDAMRNCLRKQKRFPV